jgi:diadenosine tetraphosphate (Ap4A) HIT family hydrolase
MNTRLTIPWTGDLTPREPAPRVVPEPPRRGEEGGAECRVCTDTAASVVWSDEHFTLHPPRTCSLPGTVWLASRRHVDSFGDLSAEEAAAFGPLVARVERAIIARGDVARVHLYRWGDGGAHFHVWLMPRPLGMLEAQGAMLPLWEDVLPNATEEECERAAREVAARLEVRE